MVPADKARLVIRGFLQQYGVDFLETYAPTASVTAFRLIIAIAVSYGWNLRSIDIVTAFLNGDIDTTVHMKIPDGLDLDRNIYVLCLRKALYGFKQAPRIWWQKMDSFDHSSGYDERRDDAYLPREGDRVYLLRRKEYSNETTE